MSRPWIRTAFAVVVSAVVATACSGNTSGGPSESPGAPSTSSAAASPPAAEVSGSGGTAGTGSGVGAFEGTLTSSGQYAATWTVSTDSVANPFNGVNNPSLTSDKGTFGNIAVQPDGSVAFGSAASQLTNGAYKGTGAKVTLDTTGQFVCAFAFDGDLKGSTDGAILHLAGGLRVHWTLGVGEMNCP